MELWWDPCFPYSGTSAVQFLCVILGVAYSVDNEWKGDPGDQGRRQPMSRVPAMPGVPPVRRSPDHVPGAGCSWGKHWHILLSGGYRCALLYQRCANGVHEDAPLRAGAHLLCASCTMYSAPVLQGFSLFPSPSATVALHKRLWSEMMAGGWNSYF